MLENYSISTDKSKINIPLVHQYLCNESYWAKNIPLSIVKKSIENSVCFSLFYGDEQIGFARVISDQATFGYLADVFIIEPHRGKGISKWLMQTILDNESLQGFRSWMLGTKDAHGLYEKFDFKLVSDTTRIMRKQGIDGYKNS